MPRDSIDPPCDRDNFRSHDAILIDVLQQQALVRGRLAGSAGAISGSDAAITFALISKELERDLEDLHGAWRPQKSNSMNMLM